MAKETFIMMSLQEEKSKELAHVISNKTSRKILEYLGGKDKAHEAKIAKDLKLPVSTVHYNIRQLVKSGLIEVADFRWSEKGKKVELYSVARKLIVIAPKGSDELKERLKGFIPVTLVAMFGSLGLYLYQKLTAVPDLMMAKGGALMQAAPVEEAVFAAKDAVMESAPRALPEAVAAPVMAAAEPNYALWFFIGSVIAIIISLITTYWRYRKK